MKNVVILGSTGSLGRQSLEVLKKHADKFNVLALSAHKNKELLATQAKEFDVSKTILSSKEKGLVGLCQLKEADMVINVLSGISGIEPTLASLEKTLLLGNKESLIASGKKVDIKNIIPIDSEHNAIYEILKKYPEKKIKKIILPCSGGPFFGRSRKELENISVEEALNHPRWKMGAKISLESATLINKGLEIIEAHYLFKIPLNKIEVIIHPEAIIHGVVQFEDCKIAYLSKPDMKEHIENALLESINLERPNGEIRELRDQEFKLYAPDYELFKGIDLVKKAFILGDMRGFLEKEEEILKEFIEGKIKFLEIFNRIEATLC